jgi:hypothetical protein
MNIYYKTFPISLDIVFTATDPKDLKEIHSICRKHIKTYGGFRLDKKLNQVEFHAEQDIGAWDLERLYKELEDMAYGHLYPKEDDSLDNVSEH